MKTKNIIFVPLALTAAFISANIQAATATGTLTVKATIASSCAINTSATGAVSGAVLDFGNISGLTANVDASTSTTGGTKIGVLCNNGTTWSLAADGGVNVNASQRRMASQTLTTKQYLPYNLYSDSTRATAIPVGTAFQTGTGTGALQTYDVYGRIPSGSTLPGADSYLDTVTLTITY